MASHVMLCWVGKRLLQPFFPNGCGTSCFPGLGSGLEVCAADVAHASVGRLALTRCFRGGGAGTASGVRGPRCHFGAGKADHDALAWEDDQPQGRLGGVQAGCAEVARGLARRAAGTWHFKCVCFEAGPTSCQYWMRMLCTAAEWRPILHSNSKHILLVPVMAGCGPAQACEVWHAGEEGWLRCRFHPRRSSHCGCVGNCTRLAGGQAPGYQRGWGASTA
jgi:hypothetical protein